MPDKTELQNVIESIDTIFASMNTHNLVHATKGALERHDPEMSMLVKAMRSDRSVIRCPHCGIPMTWSDVAQLWAQENKAQVVMRFLDHLNKDECLSHGLQADIQESECTK